MRPRITDAQAAEARAFLTNPELASQASAWQIKAAFHKVRLHRDQRRAALHPFRHMPGDAA